MTRRDARAVLWDNDGVLVDTEVLFYEACRESLAAEGIELAHEVFLRISLREGRSTLDLVLERGGTERDVDRVRGHRDRIFRGLLRERAVPRPGAREILESLADRIRMGVVTSAPRLEFELAHERTGFLEYLEFAVTNEDYRRSKPHPEPYLTALERHRLDPAHTVVVEDTERGLASARAAGMRCFIVRHELTRGCAFEGAEAVLEDLGQLADHCPELFEDQEPPSASS